jgi:hypothetical protein
MRIRFSLRTFLIAVSLAGVALAFCIWSVTRYRMTLAEDHLRARDFWLTHWDDVQRAPFSFSNARYEFSNGQYQWTVLPVTPTDWREIQCLGSFHHLSFHGDQCNSIEFLSCIRRSTRCLQGVYLHDCKLTPELAAAISDCSHLEGLGFEQVRPGSDRIVFHRLPNLKSVTLRSTGFVATELAWISEQPNLEKLWLLNHDVTDELASIIVACRALRELDLRDSVVSPATVQRLVKTSNVQTLRLPKVKLTSTEIEAIAASQLKYVTLHDCDFEVSIEPLLRNERLERLSVSLAQFEAIVAADLRLTRKNKLRLDVGPVKVYEDVKDDPWSKDVRVMRFVAGGTFIGPTPPPLPPLVPSTPQP